MTSIARMAWRSDVAGERRVRVRAPGSGRSRGSSVVASTAITRCAPRTSRSPCPGCANRTSPRQLLAHEGFGEQLRDAGEALHRRYENLSPDRRAEEARASEDAVQRIFGPELDALRRRVEELRAAHEPPAGPHPA